MRFIPLFPDNAAVKQRLHRRRREFHQTVRPCCGVSGPVATSEACSPVVAADSTRRFDAFFRSEYPRLLRVLSSADLSADDALQEAFAKAGSLVGAHLRLRGPRRLGAPCGRAAHARRTAISRNASSAAIERLDALSLPDSVDRDASLDLAAAIGRLPVRQRVALSLFYLGGLTSAETGEAMGISAGAVRFHLHEARARLRERLEVRDD